MVKIVEENEFEREIENGVVVVDSSTNIANEYNITNVPAIVIFKNGEKEEMLVGFKPKETIEAQIKLYL